MFKSDYDVNRSMFHKENPKGKNVSLVSNRLGMIFVYINPGVFLMGSPEQQSLYPHEKQHKVILTKGFYLQTTEVTVGQWRLFSKDGYRTDAETQGWAWCHSRKGWKIPGLLPDWCWQKKNGAYWDDPGFYQTDNYPVTCISWNDTQAFIEWLNLNENEKYRLPTEAEWEYSCRAGTQTNYSSGDDITKKSANFHRTKRSILKRRYQNNKHNMIDHSYPPNALIDSIGFSLTNKRTRPAGHYPPNDWGLFNMHGNVWEWCHDHCESDFDGKLSNIDDTYGENITDPVCEKGGYRILRGGRWL